MLLESMSTAGPAIVSGRRIQIQITWCIGDGGLQVSEYFIPSGCHGYAL